MNALLMALCLFAPQEAEAEPFDPFQWARDLDEMDLSWAWGEFYFEVGGELDLEFFFMGDESPGVHVEDSAIRDGDSSDAEDSSGFETAFRFDVTLDGFYEEWLEFSTTLRLDGTTGGDGNVGVRPEQLWVRLILLDPELLKLQLGKFSAPVGNFIPRHEPSKNPLTTWPLAYDHLTVLNSAADNNATLLSRRDMPDVKTWYTPIWQAVYGTGAMVFGTFEEIFWAVAVMNSAPGTLPENWDPNSDNMSSPNIYLRAAVPIHITTTLGGTYSVGPYENDDSVGGGGGGPGPGPVAGPAVDGRDYPQRLAGIDASFSTGFLEMFAEVYWTEFTGPRFDDLELWTYYIEAKYRISPGLFAAGRFAQIFFGDIRDAAGHTPGWDRNVSRVEFGGGYFFTNNLFFKTTAQLNYTMGGHEPNDHMLMMQIGLMF